MALLTVVALDSIDRVFVCIILFEIESKTSNFLMELF